MTRSALTAASLVTLAILAGCASPPRAPGPPGETLVLLSNKVGAPCQLIWANARVDERALERTIIAPPGSPPASLDRPVLKPGEHTVSIAASASCAGAGPSAILHVTQPVYMGKDGGKITIVLAHDATSASGIAASFDVSGGQVLSPRADGGEVDCRSRLPVDWAICRTETALARARQERDVIRVLCIGEKLREMRLLAETTSQPPGTPAPADENLDTDATRRVLAIATEAERCIGEEVMGQEGTRTDRTPALTLSAFR